MISVAVKIFNDYLKHVKVNALKDCFNLTSADKKQNTDFLWKLLCDSFKQKFVNSGTKNPLHFMLLLLHITGFPRQLQTMGVYLGLASLEVFLDCRGNST